jgi:hypothetical protein
MNIDNATMGGTTVRGALAVASVVCSSSALVSTLKNAIAPVESECRAVRLRR